MDDNHEGPVPPGVGRFSFGQHAVHDVLVDVDPEEIVVPTHKLVGLWRSGENGGSVED
jgi:hypothetical protein